MASAVLFTGVTLFDEEATEENMVIDDDVSIDTREKVRSIIE